MHSPPRARVLAGDAVDLLFSFDEAGAALPQPEVRALARRRPAPQAQPTGAPLRLTALSIAPLTACLARNSGNMAGECTPIEVSHKDVMLRL